MSDRNIPARSIPAGGIGMHLYTMREALAEDYPGTLRRLAEIGYRTVGVSGRFGHPAEEIRSYADAAGLKIVLEHVGYHRLTDNWAGALADVHTLGGQWIVVPSLPVALRTPDGFREAAAAFNAAGRLAKKEGLKLLFHNHGHDFDVVDGQVLFDILLDEVAPDLLGFELDLYWVVNGSRDPVDYFRGHPGRFPVLHVKDMAEDGSFADVGTGKLDFAAIFAEAESGGVEQWLVEHDAPTDQWESARTSYRSLAKLRY